MKTDTSVYENNDLIGHIVSNRSYCQLNILQSVALMIGRRRKMKIQLRYAW